MSCPFRYRGVLGLWVAVRPTPEQPCINGALSLRPCTNGARQRYSRPSDQVSGRSSEQYTEGGAKVVGEDGGNAGTTTEQPQEAQQ